MTAVSTAEPPSLSARESEAAARGYVPEIDGLRAFAMTAVVLQHCALMPAGWLGVWLFYVVSGFAITSSLLAVERKPQTKAKSKATVIGHFLMRRVLRIWPVYFLLIFYNVAVAMYWGASDYSEAFYLASFTYNFRIIFDGVHWFWVGHLWTISVEEHFYLVFPFIFTLLSGKRRLMALWALVALAPILRLAMSPLAASWDWTDEQRAVAVYMFSPAHFDAFALGALIALGREHIAGRLDWARNALIGAVGLLAAYFAFGIWLNAQDGQTGVDLVRNILSGILWGDGRQVLVYVAVTWSAAALVFAVVAGSPFFKKLLSIPGLQAIGRISFGAYIFHIVVIAYVNLLFPPQTAIWDPVRQLSLFAISYPLTLAVAALSFRFIEQPVLKLRKHFA